MSIDKLKSLITSKGGIAQANQFEVILPNMFGINPIDLNMICRTVSMPGKEIVTGERLIGMKPTKYAYSYNVDPIPMSFMVLNDYGAKSYFERWMNMIVNQETKNVAYKNTYVRPVVIKQLRKTLNDPYADGASDVSTMYTTTLVNAFPMSMDQITFSNDPNTLVELTVTMAYDKYKTEKTAMSYPTRVEQARTAVQTAQRVTRRPI